MNNFSENLKKIRKDNNLSQEQLADDLGVSRQAISKWESGVAYPEMDKIIQICKKFDLNIDDLLNKDIREAKGEEESKNNINKNIEEVLTFVTDTVNMFSSMTLKTKLKCIFEQVILLGIFSIILLIIGALGGELISGIFYNILPENVYYVVYNILAIIYLIFAIFTATIVLIHVFQNRYLNYYKDIKKETNNIDEENQNKEYDSNTDKMSEKTKADKILFKNSKNKIIIRDPKHSEYKTLNGIFKLLILFIKFFTLLGVLLLCFVLFGLVALFIASFTIVKTGVFFVGLIVGTIGLSSIIIVIILWLLNFIFTRKSDKKKMIWTFIISIIVCGISGGLLFIGSLQFNISDDTDKNLLKTESFKIDMQDDLTIVNYDKIEYVEKDIDNVIIEYQINKNYSVHYEIYPSSDTGSTLYFYSYNPNIFETIRIIIEELNNSKVININDELHNIKVYASKDNIEKFKLNKENYNNKIKTRDETYESYEEQIANLEDQLEKKQDEIDRLQEKLDNFQNDNSN